MREEDKRRLALIYTKSGMNSEDMALTTFYRLAEQLDYKPWKELCLYNEDEGYTKDNIYFGYRNKPSLHQVGLDDNRERKRVDPKSEHIYMLRLLGITLQSYSKPTQDMLDYFSKLSSDFDTEALQTLLGYLGNIQRSVDNSLAYLDSLSVNDKFIAPEKKLASSRQGSFRLESTLPDSLADTVKNISDSNPC